MPDYKVDKEETKERIKIFAVVTFFGSLFLVGLALIVSDFLGKL